MFKYLIISFNNVKAYNILFGNFNYAKDLLLEIYLIPVLSTADHKYGGKPIICYII